MRFSSKHLEFIRELKNTEKELRVELKESLQQMTEEPFKFFFYLFCIIPCIIIGYFFYLLILVVILLYGSVRVVYTVLKQLSTPSVPPVSLSTVYSVNCISEMIFLILQENYKELRIDKPLHLEDIAPVSHVLMQVENGFEYFRFIVHHPIATAEPAVPLSDLMELLNLKLAQHLQMYFYNCVTVYEGMPVVKVFRVAESPHHPHCYDICIMLVDSPEKASYVRSLESAKRKIDVPQQLQDKEF